MPDSALNGATATAGRSVQDPAPLLATHDDALAAAAEFAAAIKPGAADRDRAGSVPWDELALFDVSGLASILIPAELGGPGLGYATLAEVVRRIAAVDPAVAQIPQAHFLFLDVLIASGPEAGRRRVAADVLAGARLGNAAAERGGQHAQDLRVRVTRAADGTLRLNGTKYYCTGAISSRWIAVTAIDENEQQLMVYVERDADGVRVDDDWNVMGQRSTVSGTSTFDNVLVDPELVVDYGELYTTPQTFGARGQLVHAAIEVGIAGGALADAVWFVREKSRPFFEAVRSGWAERAADDPHIVHRVGELATKVSAAEALLRDAAAALDAVDRQPDTAEDAARASLAVARAKAFGSETAVEVASELFALAGTSATDEKYDLSRHWRNARTHSVHDPVAWKYHHIGAFELTGTLPPSHGQL